MALITRLKKVIKSNGVLYAHAAALRSSQPLSNVVHLRRNLLFSKVMTRTLVSYDRLLNALDLAESVGRDGVEGAFVECGVWRGGVAGLLGLVARRVGGGRQTHLFDSFQGLPNPTAADGVRADETTVSDRDGALKPIGLYVATLPDVEDFLFDVLRLDREAVRLHEGWFQQTLPRARESVGPIALLRIDADWYESVKVCLDNLYGNVSPGGYVILDDYGMYPGCRQAFEEFAAAQHLNVSLQRIDETGVWFQKPRKS